MKKSIFLIKKFAMKTLFLSETDEKMLFFRQSAPILAKSDSDLESALWFWGSLNGRNKRAFRKGVVRVRRWEWKRGFSKLNCYFLKMFLFFAFLIGLSFLKAF